MLIKSQNKKEKLGEEEMNEQIGISMVKVEDKEVSPTLDEEVKKVGLHLCRCKSSRLRVIKV